MDTARSFEDLIAWQRAHQFVLSLYRATERLPKNELFGLTAQMRLSRLLEGYIQTIERRHRSSELLDPSS